MRALVFTRVGCVVLHFGKHHRGFVCLRRTTLHAFIYDASRNITSSCRSLANHQSHTYTHPYTHAHLLHPVQDEHDVVLPRPPRLELGRQVERARVGVHHRMEHAAQETHRRARPVGRVVVRHLHLVAEKDVWKWWCSVVWWGVD